MRRFLVRRLFRTFIVIEEFNRNSTVKTRTGVAIFREEIMVWTYARTQGHTQQTQPFQHTCTAAKSVT